MGINISIEHPETYQEISGWDPGRYAGDKEFFDNFAGVDLEQKEAPGFPHMDDRCWYRPKDIAAFRERAGQLPVNAERWLLAADLLEANPDYWLYFSY